MPYLAIEDAFNLHFFQILHYAMEKEMSLETYYIPSVHRLSLFVDGNVSHTADAKDGTRSAT